MGWVTDLERDLYRIVPVIILGPYREHSFQNMFLNDNCVLDAMYWDVVVNNLAMACALTQLII